MFNRKARIVRSIDLSKIFAFGVKGGLADLKGLKLRIADTILLATVWRVRTRIIRQFRVPSTSTASLQGIKHGIGNYIWSIHTSWPHGRHSAVDPEARKLLLLG